MHFTILTIFPEMFPGTLEHSLAGKALKAGLWSYDIIDIKDFGIGRHKKVDDTPYGGGNGMIIRADVLGCAIESALLQRKYDKLYYMSPRGERLTQELAWNCSNLNNILIVSGRYEGIDYRVIEEYNLEELSIGDYVLSGGEIAAQVFLDTCIRLIPGVMHSHDSAIEESFGKGEFNYLLEYPIYTKPNVWKDRQIPEVLSSGNHAQIASWRKKMAEEITNKNRPDLYLNYKNLIKGT